MNDLKFWMRPTNRDFIEFSKLKIGKSKKLHGNICITIITKIKKKLTLLNKFCDSKFESLIRVILMGLTIIYTNL